MAPNATADDSSTDPRPTSVKVEMAEWFAEHELDYRDADQLEIVYEDDAVVIIADHNAGESGEWADEFDVSHGKFSQWMHTLARQACDYEWGVSWPVVFDKMPVRRYGNK